MVLLAKCLLLLFMIIVVHGHIVVDVEQKVNIDGCCNGCCPCNSCEPVKYKCKDGIDGECRKKCRKDEIDMGDCEATNGEDCDYQCCVKNPCWDIPVFNLEECTKTTCRRDGTIIIKEVSYFCNGGKGCCFLPNTDPKKMVCPGYKYVGGCLVETCENTTWVPSFEHILDQCLKCITFNDPHFRAFSGAEFDWHIPCNHALTQEGYSHIPDFGVFMDFTSLTKDIAVVGPTTYEEKIGIVRVNTVKMVPSSPNVVSVNLSPIIITTTLQRFVGTNIWAKKEFITGQVAGRSSDCIWIYAGSTLLVIQRCAEQITIWAPQWGHGGYPKLGGLCSTNDQVRDLVARDGSVYPDPGVGNPCDANFGYGWQRNKLHQSKTECPKKKTNSGKRKKRQAGDPQTVCSNFTNSPYHDECLEIVENSTLTGPNVEMFKRTCMFDLCVVVEYVDNKTLTKEQMAEQIRQITAEVKNQEDKTVDYCMALGGLHVGGQSLYFEMGMKLSWNIAVFWCEDRGMQLAVLDDPWVVYDFVVEHFGNVTFWVGGLHTEDYCPALNPPHGYDDLPCYQPHYYICEIVSDKE